MELDLNLSFDEIYFLVSAFNVAVKKGKLGKSINKQMRLLRDKLKEEIQAQCKMTFE